MYVSDIKRKFPQNIYQILNDYLNFGVGGRHSRSPPIIFILRAHFSSWVEKSFQAWIAWSWWKFLAATSIHRQEFSQLNRHIRVIKRSREIPHEKLFANINWNCKISEIWIRILPIEQCSTTSAKRWRLFKREILSLNPFLFISSRASKGKPINQKSIGHKTFFSEREARLIKKSSLFCYPILSCLFSVLLTNIFYFIFCWMKIYLYWGREEKIHCENYERKFEK